EPGTGERRFQAAAARRYDSAALAAALQERFLFEPNRTGNVSVCLAYPNSYEVAMGNLGYQAVFRILATTPGVLCERLTLDTAGGRRTLESRRAPAAFDVLAFSLSFESDYPNVVRMLDAAGIPARTEERRKETGRWPLLLAGGPATFLNPEPVAPLFDVFLLGEAEEMLREAFAGAETWKDLSAGALLERLAAVEGAYVPANYRVEYDAGGDIASMTDATGASARVRRRYLSELDREPARTSILAPAAVFGDYYLVEASRGCEWGCRFCAAGFMYRPVRHRAAQRVADDAVAGLEYSETIGLVGAEMASHPGIAATCERVVAAGGRVSPSSLKADMISPRLAAAIAAGGTRAATIAPEAGSERMRRLINKNLIESEILRAADLMVGDGVDLLKLYFMCALPTEERSDLEAIVDLTAAIRDRMVGRGRVRGRVGRIRVSVNPFVPKPWTPLQWEAMAGVAEIRRRLGFLRRALSALPNVEMESESPREAYLQTLLSRGDRRVAAVVERIARSNRGWWQELSDLRRTGAAGVDLDRFVTREWPEDVRFPWDFIDHGIDRRYLWAERRRALAGRETEPCDVATCHTCGAC
ncbi:MAG: radical SAM protein, partial [Deltaproteobacteria bacterium]